MEETLLHDSCGIREIITFHAFGKSCTAEIICQSWQVLYTTIILVRLPMSVCEVEGMGGCKVAIIVLEELVMCSRIIK